MTRSLKNMDTKLYERIFQGWKGKYRVLDFTHLVFGEKISLKKPGSVKLFFLGEPLLHPEFDEFIKIANKHKVVVNLQTNGTLLYKEENITRLLDSGLFAVGISIDGLLFDDYENIRVNSNAERVNEGIKQLIKKRNSSGSDMRIEVSTIVPEFEKSEKIYNSFFRDTLKKVDSVKYIVLDRFFSPEYHDNTGKIIFYENSINDYEEDKILCDEPFFKLNVLADGSVTPCCHDIDGNMSFGNALDKNIDDIWNGKALKKLRTGLYSHDLSSFSMCRECRFGK